MKTTKLVLKPRPSLSALSVLQSLDIFLHCFMYIVDLEELEKGDWPIATRELCLRIGKKCRNFAKAINVCGTARRLVNR
jgi:hypothetical protein